MTSIAHLLNKLGNNPKSVIPIHIWVSYYRQTVLFLFISEYHIIDKQSNLGIKDTPDKFKGCQEIQDDMIFNLGSVCLDDGEIKTHWFIIGLWKNIPESRATTNKPYHE